MNDEEEGGEGDEYEYVKTPEDSDPRHAYVKRMIKESKDLPAQFRRPDYKAGMASEEEEKAPPLVQEQPEATAKPAEKKEEYEL